MRLPAPRPAPRPGRIAASVVIEARVDEHVVRSYRDGDESAILRLFEQSFSPGRGLEHWRWKYRDNPFGTLAISVAIAPGGELVAHYAAYPVPFRRSRAGTERDRPLPPGRRHHDRPPPSPRRPRPHQPARPHRAALLRAPVRRQGRLQLRLQHRQHPALLAALRRRPQGVGHRGVGRASGGSASRSAASLPSLSRHPRRRRRARRRARRIVRSTLRAAWRRTTVCWSNDASRTSRGATCAAPTSTTACSASIAAASWWAGA